MKAFAAALGLALLAAQDQPPPKPTFKSAVDLVPVDVNVIDKSGGRSRTRRPAISR